MSMVAKPNCFWWGQNPIILNDALKKQLRFWFRIFEGLDLYNQPSKSKSLKLVIAFLLFIPIVSAQGENNNYFLSSKHRMGFIVGYGGQNFEQLVNDLHPDHRVPMLGYLEGQGKDVNSPGLSVTYDYQVLFLQLQYYYAFLRRNSWGLDLLVQPQINRTRFKHVDSDLSEVKGFEFGVNVGVLIRKNFFRDHLSLYFLISSGPHYVSGTPQRQSEGFIFSDNFFVGLNLKIYNRIYLDLRPGFRHISNAGLKHPNGGVNDLVLSAGVMVFL